MKRIATILVMLTAALSGILYWLDLSRCMDPVSGFITAGPLMVRYLVMGAVLALCGLASLLLAARRPAVLNRRSLPIGICCILSSIAFAVCGGLGLAGSAQLSGSYKILNLLFLVSALWLMLAGLSRLVSTVQPPTTSALWGVLGTISLYLLTVVRFGTRPTGLARVAPAVQVFAVLMALLFLTALVRGVYLPGARCGRWLYFTGMSAFFLCACLELPQTLFFWGVGTSGIDQLAIGAALGLLGVLGAVCALGVADGELPESQEPQQAQQEVSDPVGSTVLPPEA